jgi:hypothetical protein
MSLLLKLRMMIAELPPGAALTLPAEWLRAELDAAGADDDDDGRRQDPAVAPGAPLTVEQTAERYHLSPSSIRGMLAAGRFAGAFRLNGAGAWRIPTDSLTAFECASAERTRATVPVRSLRVGESVGDWRRSGRRARRGPHDS